MQIIDKAIFDNLEPTYLKIREYLDTISNMSEDKRSLILICVDEILTNIISYSYENMEIGEFKVELNKIDNYVEIRIIDSGIPFNPIETNEKKIDEDSDIGGLGISIVKNLVNSINYIRKENKNILTIIFDLD